jgi:FKBP-type peptidyl-prolyl cis-trans isomerase FkpA
MLIGSNRHPARQSPELISRALTHLGVLVWLAVHPAASGAEDRPFENDDQKYLYYWGTTFGEQLEAAGIRDPGDVLWVVQGLEEKLAGKAPSYNADYPSLLSNYLIRRRNTAAEAEAEASRKYVDAMAAEKGARTTDSGLVFRETLAGKGATPTSKSRVTVHYTGTLRDATVFDSSRARNKPLETRLDQVIPCWTEAIPMMRVGGRATITCPAEIAYGIRGNRGIPGGAALTFDVELLAVDE